MMCEMFKCTELATHQRECLDDSAGLGFQPGAIIYMCEKHAKICEKLNQEADKLRADFPKTGLPGRVAKPFGPIEKIPLPPGPFAKGRDC